MRATIHLKFSVDVENEGDAWEICEKLEEAALKQEYVGVSTWVESGDRRSGILVPEGQDPTTTEAQRLERTPGLQPTSIGDAEGRVSPGTYGQEDWD